jgi:hypothetical protein
LVHHLAATGSAADCASVVPGDSCPEVSVSARLRHGSRGTAPSAIPPSPPVTAPGEAAVLVAGEAVVLVAGEAVVLVTGSALSADPAARPSTPATLAAAGCSLGTVASCGGAAAGRAGAGAGAEGTAPAGAAAGGALAGAGAEGAGARGAAPAGAAAGGASEAGSAGADPPGTGGRRPSRRLMPRLARPAGGICREPPSRAAALAARATARSGAGGSGATLSSSSDSHGAFAEYTMRRKSDDRYGVAGSRGSPTYSSVARTSCRRGVGVTTTGATRTGESTSPDGFGAPSAASSRVAS